MEKIIFIGYGGHAESVADCIERQGIYGIAGYTDRKERKSRYPYLGTDETLLEWYKKGIRNAAVCIGFMGKGDIRMRLYDVLKKTGYTLPVIADPSAVISESAKIGEGTFIGKMAVVNAEARIGKMAIINSKALVEHGCMVGDYTHIAVGATLCGQAKVGRACLVGANATILQGRTVGTDVRIGAGMVVKDNVGEGLVCGRYEDMDSTETCGGGYRISLYSGYHKAAFADCGAVG